MVQLESMTAILTLYNNAFSLYLPVYEIRILLQQSQYGSKPSTFQKTSVDGSIVLRYLLQYTC